MLSFKRTVLMPVLTLIGISILGVIFPQVLNPYMQTIAMYCGINIILAVSLNLVNGFTGQFSIGHAGFMAAGAYLSAYLTMQVPHLSALFPILAASTGGLLDSINFLVTTLLGGLLAAFAGYAVG